MSILARLVAAIVLGMTCLIAWGDLVFAGDAPGEGFTAAILILLVVILQFIVLGRSRALDFLPSRVYGLSLLAGATLLLGLAAGPVVLGGPLLASFKVLLGPFILSSSTLFDVAVFLMVGGGMLSAISELEVSKA